jgi:outer membrane receptor protein involved in Fe transport
VEGLVINPNQNLSNLGGTLLDILRNTPSIRVGDDGGISLRGSTGTNVLINGRNSSLTRNLDRIPASAVEQIKVITNPNARYDAEAEGGIIDIILKKGDDLGTHMGVDALYGTRGRMNAGVQINHRTIDLNVYGGYNLRRWRDVGYRKIDREIFDDGETLNQRTNSNGENLGHTFNYGADYYFGKNILSYQGVFSTSLDKQFNNLYSRLIDIDSDQLLLEYVRTNDESETDDGTDNALIYERTFDDKERSFKFTASQSYTNQFKTQNIDIFRNSDLPDPATIDGKERAVIDEKRHAYIFQADYIHPLQNRMKLETGLKSNIRNFSYDYDYARLDNTAEEFFDDPAISNQFDYKDRVHAGYLILSRGSEKLDITAGLRGEYTTLDIYQYNTDESNKQDYFSLFPSLQMLYKFAPGNCLKFTYSRRIERPTAWRLNPFPDITDSLNVRRGNPNLKPEMINSFEFGHVYESDKSSFTTNLFYRRTSGELDFITFVEDGISYSQPENLNKSESYGVELIGVSEVRPWWTVSGSVTGFGIEMDGSNLGEEFVNNGLAMNTKLTSDFKLPFDFSLQFVFNYDSPEIEAQGRDLEQYYLDASLQRSFLKSKGSLSVSMRDVFDTRRFAGNSLTNTFEQTFYAKRETRIVLVSARYNF